MVTQDVQDKVEETVALPTLPGVVVRLDALLADPDTGLGKVAEVVAEDAPIAARVLRVANTAYYGQREPVADILRAINVLGGRVLKNLVLQSAIIQKYESLRGDAHFDLDRVWKHTILTARLCERLAAACRPQGRPLGTSPAEMYTCGLLHDLGKVAMLDSFGSGYLETVARTRDEDSSLVEAEIDDFGFSHPQVGGVVASLWRLPAAVVRAVEGHHASARRLESSPSLTIVVHADRLANSVQSGRTPASKDVMDAATVKRLGLDPARLPDLIEFAGTSLQEIVV